MSTKTIDSYPIRVYMNARRRGITQADAAEIAEISRRSGQRIDAGRLHPQRGEHKPQRTVPDPLAQVWDQELEPMLVREPKLKAMTLFDYLQEKYPGQYPPGAADAAATGADLESVAWQATRSDV